MAGPMAGAAGMSFLCFLGWNLSGALIWWSLITTIGYLVGDELESVAHVMHAASYCNLVSQNDRPLTHSESQTIFGWLSVVRHCAPGSCRRASPYSFSFGEIIVGDLSPLALNFTLELMPFALKFIVIHSSLHTWIKTLIRGNLGATHAVAKNRDPSVSGTARACSRRQFPASMRRFSARIRRDWQPADCLLERGGFELPSPVDF
jgi:hypothetical protein